MRKVWGKIRKNWSQFEEKCGKWNSCPPGTVRLATALVRLKPFYLHSKNSKTKCRNSAIKWLLHNKDQVPQKRFTPSTLARVFPCVRLAHPEDQNEEENEENLRKYERNYRKKRKDWRSVLLLPTREWEAGYGPGPTGKFWVPWTKMKNPIPKINNSHETSLNVKCFCITVSYKLLSSFDWKNLIKYIWQLLIHK